jgi:hypothetical protein
MLPNNEITTDDFDDDDIPSGFSFNAFKVLYNTELESKRNGNFDINIFTYPNFVSDVDILNKNVDTRRDIQVLGRSEYVEFQRPGNFVLIVPCNRRKKITNELGQLVDTTDDNPNGIYTEFKGFITVDHGRELPNTLQRNCNVGDRIDKVRIKIPQSAPTNQTFTFGFGPPPNGTNNSLLRNEEWRKQHYTFNIGKFYSIAKFNGTTFGESGGDNANRWDGDVNDLTKNPANNSGVLTLKTLNSQQYGFPLNGTARFKFDVTTGVNSGPSNPLVEVFGVEWLNLCLYLPQFRVTRARNRDVSAAVTDVNDNDDRMVRCDKNAPTQWIGGDVFGTWMYLRSDRHPTDFIEIPPQDLILMANSDNLGFIEDEFVNPLTGNYKKTSSNAFFFKGFGVDVVRYLIDLGIITA